MKNFFHNHKFYIILCIFICLYVLPNAFAAPIPVKTNNEYEKSAVSLQQHNSQNQALKSIVTQHAIVENERNSASNNSNSSRARDNKPTSDGGVDTDKNQEKKLSGPKYAVYATTSETSTYETSTSEKSTHEIASAMKLSKSPAVSDHNFNKGAASEDSVTFSFWPSSTFDIRMRNNKNKDLASLQKVLNDFAEKVNNTKEGFLATTTTYRSRPASEEEKARINYFAGIITPDIKDVNEAKLSLTWDSLNEELSQKMGGIENYREAVASDLKMGGIENYREAVASDLEDKEAGSTYRIARYSYEAGLHDAGRGFSYEINKLKDGIKEPIIEKDKTGTEMVIAIPHLSNRPIESPEAEYAGKKPQADSKFEKN